MMHRRRSQPAGGDWIYLAFLVCLVVGVLVGGTDGPTDAEIQRREDCQPVP
jgi:hypothetical protein